MSKGCDKLRTYEAHNLIRNLTDDNLRLRFKLNWKMPHSIFNLVCTLPQIFDMSYYNDSTLPIEKRKMVDWYAIFKSNDLGYWSHGGKA